MIAQSRSAWALRGSITTAVNNSDHIETEFVQ